MKKITQYLINSQAILFDYVVQEGDKTMFLFFKLNINFSYTTFIFIVIL